MKRTLVFLVLLAAAAEARAGTYTQQICTPNQQPLYDGILVEAAGGTTWSDKCIDSGPMTAQLVSKSAGSYLRIHYETAPPIRVSGISLERRTTNVRNGGAIYEITGTTDSCSAARCEPFGDVAGPFTQNGLDLTELDINLKCPDTTACSQSATLAITSLAFTLRDDAIPEVNALFPAGRQQGVIELPYDATDVGSGVFQAEVVVDGSAQPRQTVGDCSLPFTKRVPCRTAVSGTLPLDTTVLSDGDHQVSLNVYDATGTNVATAGPATIRVANGTPAAGTGSSTAPAAPVVAGAKIADAGRRVLRRTVAKPAIAKGRLLDEQGQPVAGAALAVFTAKATPGGKEKWVAAGLTEADGSFRIVVPPGPSRRVSVRYNGETLWRFAVRVPAPLGLSPSRAKLDNGDVLALTAYLAGGKAPKGSADVAFQVKIGRRWETFAKGTLDENGRALVRHRFTKTFYRLTYRFRAITLKRKRFPYENARSRVVSVQVN